MNLLVAFESFSHTVNGYRPTTTRLDNNTIIIIEITMPADQIQYSEKYFDDNFEYRYLINWIKA